MSLSYAHHIHVYPSINVAIDIHTKSNHASLAENTRKCSSYNTCTAVHKSLDKRLYMNVYKRKQGPLEAKFRGMIISQGCRKGGRGGARPPQKKLSTLCERTPKMIHPPTTFRVQMHDAT